MTFDVCEEESLCATVGALKLLCLREKRWKSRNIQKRSKTIQKRVLLYVSLRAFPVRDLHSGSLVSLFFPFIPLCTWVGLGNFEHISAKGQEFGDANETPHEARHGRQTNTL